MPISSKEALSKGIQSMLPHTMKVVRKNPVKAYGKYNTRKFYCKLIDEDGLEWPAMFQEDHYLLFFEGDTIAFEAKQRDEWFGIHKNHKVHVVSKSTTYDGADIRETNHKGNVKIGYVTSTRIDNDGYEFRVAVVDSIPGIKELVIYDSCEFHDGDDDYSYSNCAIEGYIDGNRLFVEFLRILKKEIRYHIVVRPPSGVNFLDETVAFTNEEGEGYSAIAMWSQEKMNDHHPPGTVQITIAFRKRGKFYQDNDRWREKITWEYSYEDSVAKLVEE